MRIPLMKKEIVISYDKSSVREEPFKIKKKIASKRSALNVVEKRLVLLEVDKDDTKV